MYNETINYMDFTLFLTLNGWKVTFKFCLSQFRLNEKLMSFVLFFEITHSEMFRQKQLDLISLF